MQYALSLVNTYFFGPALPLLLFVCGAVFTVRLRGFFIFHPGEVVRALLCGAKSGGEGSPLRSLSVALAGTLGVGNIAGVAAALSAGGAGALFWMWVSAFAAMALKYTETSLALAVRGTTMEYMLRCLKNERVGRAAAAAFAVICLGASFSIGSVVQINAAALSLERVFGMPKLLCGVIFAAVGAAVIFGGFSRVSAITSRLIPALCFGYIAMCAAMLFSGRELLGDIFGEILRGAFTPDSAAGGVGGYLMMRSLRFGTSRGVLSNEAGCGTAPLAHSQANNTPHAQGCLGIFEVFCDTVLLCTLTGLCILIYLRADPLAASLDGMSLSLCAANAILGTAAQAALAVSVALFALASYLGWAYYGTRALMYLTRSKTAVGVYTALYCLSAVYAALASSALMWELADFSVSAMALVNTLCLIRGIAANKFGAEVGFYPRK